MIQLLKENIPLLKIISGLSINFGAALIFFAIVAPGFILPETQKDIVSLTMSILSGIVFIIIAYLCEREI